MPSPPEDDAPRHIRKADSGTRMPVEIERKFLVADDGWRSAVIDSEKLRDGLVGEFDGCNNQRARPVPRQQRARRRDDALAVID
jgi:hypothetical protein